TRGVKLCSGIGLLSDLITRGVTLDHARREEKRNNYAGGVEPSRAARRWQS
ncbi:hypothetical protein L195_g064732, partial [Trifolium pratense]